MCDKDQTTRNASSFDQDSRPTSKSMLDQLKENRRYTLDRLNEIAKRIYLLENNPKFAEQLEDYYRNF